MMNDMKNMTAEKLENSKIVVKFMGDIPILDCYQETLSYLAEKGFNREKFEDEFYADNTISIFSPPVYYSRVQQFYNQDFERNSIQKINNISYVSTFYAMYDIYDYGYANTTGSKTVRINSAALQLMKNASVVLKNEKPLAVILDNEGSVFLIKDTPENQALLKEATQNKE